MTGAHTDTRLALVVAAALTIAAIVVAALVRLAYAAPARARLGFGFAGLEPTPHTALSILATNASLLIALTAAAVVAQAPWWRPPDAHPAALAIVALAAVDTLVALEIALNVLIVGAALGAYGTRMAAAILPHGPVELAAFAVALALYLRARRGPVPARRIATTTAGCLGLLAVAAVLETYAAP